MPKGKTAFNLAEVLHALGDPLRLAMVKKMAENGEVSCGDMCPVTARSTLTHHLTILRESGVIVTRKQGQMHLNALNREGLDKAFPHVLEAVLAGVPSGHPKPGRRQG